MKPNSPCYGCQRRSATCHAECGDYAEFARQQEAYRNNKFRIKNDEYAVIGRRKGKYKWAKLKEEKKK